MPVRSLILTAFALGLVRSVAAQMAPEQLRTTRAGVLVARQLQLIDPLQTSSLGAALTQVSFEGSFEDLRAKARLGLQWLGGGVAFTASAPISKDKTTVFADLDLLRPSSTVGMSVNLIPWSTTASGTQTPSLFTGSVEVGREAFAFNAGPGGAETTERRTPLAVSAALGRPFSEKFFLGAEYRYARAYKATDEVDLCTAVPGGIYQTCEPAVLAGPTSKKAHVLSGLARYRFVEKLGVELRVSYDLESEAVGVQLPIAFAPNLSREFAGGLRLNWESKSKALQVQIIATRPFGTHASGATLVH